jgi:hypothetical protein
MDVRQEGQRTRRLTWDDSRQDSYANGGNQVLAHGLMTRRLPCIKGRKDFVPILPMQFCPR